MNSRIRNTCVFISLATLWASQAFALDLSLLGGINYPLPSLTTLNQGVPTGSTVSLGGGVSLAYELNSNLALELEALALPRTYQPSGKISFTEKRLHLPLFLRYT